MKRRSLIKSMCATGVAMGMGISLRNSWAAGDTIKVGRLDFTKPFRVEATYNEHAKILGLIIQRRADQAQSLLKSHIEESKAEVRKITLHMLHTARGE